VDVDDFSRHLFLFLFFRMLRLANRSLLRVGGKEAAPFLQGLITKDIE
jgi:folate-binding Fe-S cluster repair protein YgfZ